MTTPTKKNVTIYSTPSCPYCIHAKEYLREEGVPFKDIDVSMDQAGAEEMIRKTGQLGVPVIDVDGRIMVGFRKDLLARLINE